MSSSGHITTQLFVGILITADLRMLFEENGLTLDSSFETSFDLVFCNKEGKEYVGQYFDRAFATINEIEKAVSTIKSSLVSFFPKVNPESLSFQIFGQLFLN